MLAIIVAHDEHHVIGQGNKIPWHLPNDFKFVKEKTTGHTIVMGKKTYESIGKPLPNRRNVVLTSDIAFQVEGIDVIHQIEEIEKLSGEVYIFGGAQLYTAMMEKVSDMFITVVHHQFEGDVYFPQYNEKTWQLISTREGVVDDKNKWPHTFYHYKRKG